MQQPWAHPGFFIATHPQFTLAAILNLPLLYKILQAQVIS
jgi:hypothetical protein